MRRFKAAFSLIESAIVLALVGLVIGGIWSAASSYALQSKVTRAMNGMALIVQKARAAYNYEHAMELMASAGTNTYQIAEWAVASGAVQPNFATAGASPGLLRGMIFGTNMQITLACYSSQMPCVVVQFHTLKARECRALVLNVSRHFRNRENLYSIYHDNPGTQYTSFPISPSASVCPNDGTTLNFHFKL